MTQIEWDEASTGIPIIGSAAATRDEWQLDGDRFRLRQDGDRFYVERWSALVRDWISGSPADGLERLAQRTEELRLDRQRIVLFAAALARSIGLAETLSFEAPSGFTRLAERHHEALLRVAVAVGLPLEQWKVKVPEGLTPDPETAEVARRLGIEIQERRTQ
jgi:hypothetical protein